MATDLSLQHHRGAPTDVADILRKPVSQELLNRDLARLGSRLRWRRAAARARPREAAAPSSAGGGEGAEHDHVLGLIGAGGAHQVATVGRSQLPGKLELHEQEQALGHVCTVSFLRGAAAAASREANEDDQGARGCLTGAASPKACATG